MRVGFVAWLCAAVCIGSATGQIHEGTIEVSGSSGFVYSSQTLSSQISVGLDGGDAPADGVPDIDVSNGTLMLDGVYYTGQWGFGGTVGYTWLTLGAMGDELTLSGMLLGPVCKFVHPVNDQFTLFGMGSVGLSRAKVSLRGEDEKADGYFFRIGGGAKYFLTDYVSLDGTLAYQYATMKADGVEVDLSGFSFGVGLAAYFGR